MTAPKDNPPPVSGNEPGADKLVLTSPDEASSLKDFALWAGVIVLAVLTIFSPAMHGDFLWDDDRHVEHNRNLRDVTGLGKIWTALGASRGGTPQYYPLTHTTYWLEYQLSGAQPGRINTTIFHVNNMLLHAGAAILLWFILRRLAIPGAWVAAAVFALHPVQAESVAWISERKNVLAGVFYFGAILAFLKSPLGVRSASEDAASRPARGRAPAASPDPAQSVLQNRFYWLAFGLFVCAMLSKTVAASMPAVVLVLIWYKRGHLTSRHFLALAPFFVIGVGMGLLTSWIERHEVGAMGPEWDFSVAQRILIAGRAVWFYAGKLLWPANLAFIYPRWNVTPEQRWQWMFPLALVLVVGVLFLLRKRIGRGPIAAALIFVGVLVPALGFVDFYPMRYSFVANHFQYLAAPALIALVVALAARLIGRVAARVAAAPYVAAGAVLVALGVVSLMHSTIYASQISLWSDTARRNPDSWMARNNHGFALLLSASTLPPDEAAPLLATAAGEFERAVTLKPDHLSAWNSWGQTLLQQGKPQQALEKFDRALAINPDNLDVFMNRGRTLFQLQRLDEALAAYQRAWALAESPEHKPYVSRLKAASLQQHLGRIHVELGDLDAAALAYANAARMAPNAVDVRFEYGTLLARQGKREQAAEQFALAIRDAPTYLDPRISLGRLMIEAGNLNGAQAQLTAATTLLRQRQVAPELSPELPRLQEAVQMFDAAMRLRDAAATQSSTTQSSTTRSSTTQSSTTPSAPTPPPSTQSTGASIPAAATTTPTPTQP